MPTAAAGLWCARAAAPHPHKASPSRPGTDGSSLGITGAITPTAIEQGGQQLIAASTCAATTYLSLTTA